MKAYKKLYSAALAATFLFLLLIFVSLAASAVSSPTITETQITTNPSNSEHPAIYGNTIVWQDDRNGNWDIYIYDLLTRKETHTTNTANQVSPDIYGNKVVWEDERNGGHDVYLEDLSTQKQTRITTSGKACRPKIYGNRIVWMDGRNGGSLNENNWADGNWDIYMCDLSTSTEYQITTNESIQQDPDIYGDRIVWWQDNRNTNDEYYRCDIYMYDLSTKKETHVSNYGYQNYVPIIYGDRIVWTAEDEASNYNIGVFDLSTSSETEVPTGYYGESFTPTIYKDRIVWKDGRNFWPGDGNYDIYMYNLSTSTETQITTNESRPSSPAIYGDRIVWQDGRNGNENDIINSDIYMATLSYGPGLPVADFSASTTSGNAPLKVKFTSTSTGSPMAWKWNFGDGSALVTEQNPEHTYSKAGSYTVKHTAINAYGRDTETKTNYINVRSAAPKVAFSASPVSGKAPLKVQFRDKSTNNPASWKWSFGDGTYSTSKNPAHTYRKVGKYTVTLTAKNRAGSNTKTMLNYITVKSK